MTRVASLLIVLSVAFSAGAAGTVIPYPLKTRDVRLEVKADFEQSTLTGTVRLEVENTSNRSIPAIELNLNRLMRYAKVTDDRGELRFDQQVVTFEDRPLLQVNHAVVALRHGLAPRARTAITVAYSGHLVGYPETGSLYIRDTIDPAFTILRVDAFAFPMIGSTSAARQRAAGGSSFTFDARVSAPSTHTVATGGHFIDKVEDKERTTWHYRSDVPVPFLNVTIAKYRTIDADGARIFYFPEDAAGAETVSKKVVAAMALLTRWLGPLPRNPEFTLIEIPDGWGSQADLNAGVIQTASAFRNAGAMQEVYHELSHFWNVPDTDLPSSRWNEGLASYLQVRMAAELDGTNDIDRRAARVTARLLKTAAEDKQLASVPFSRYGAAEMTDYSYGTGFLMFVALDKQIGADALTHALHDYYQAYKTSGAGFDQFIATANTSAGTDLRPFFDDWFRTTTWLKHLQSEASIPPPQ